MSALIPRISIAMPRPTNHFHRPASAGPPGISIIDCASSPSWAWPAFGPRCGYMVRPRAMVRARIGGERGRPHVTGRCRRRDGLVGVDGRHGIRWRRGLGRMLSELDADGAQPPTDVPVDRRRTEWNLFVEHPVAWMEDERPRLESAESAV